MEDKQFLILMMNMLSLKQLREDWDLTAASLPRDPDLNKKVVSVETI
jgi:hypothetical protein